MTITFRALFFLPFLVSASVAWAQQSFDLSVYYDVMASNKIQDIDNELKVLEKFNASSKAAYEGTLMMKKAGLLKKAKDKIDLFKAGRKKLEAVIKTEPGNAEWRFLRLMIQENAPKAVNYRNELDTDSKFIVNNYKSLSPVVQQAINSYSKNSKILNSKDF